MRVWICDVSEPAKDQDQKAEPLQWDKLEHCDRDHLKNYFQYLSITFVVEALEAQEIQCRLTLFP